MNMIFPMAEYWWVYLAFTALILGLLALDLGVFHKKDKEVSFRDAATWSVIWVILSIAFGWGLSKLAPEAQSSQVFLEYLTGYVIEKTLAVDNIFIFVVIFGFFRIPKEYQHRVLFYGIFGALVMRAIFIGLGSYLMQFAWVHIVFGAFLILTAIKMAWKPEEDANPAENKFFQWLKRKLPLTDKMHGHDFWVKENGRWLATPLFFALLVLEFSDVIFAIDSVPAIFAITDDPLIVLTSNIFAILGLRSLYFMLAGVIDKFYMLKYALAAILGFVGLKMVWLNRMFDGHFPITWSLSIIGGLVTLGVVGSLVFPKKKPEFPTENLPNNP